MQGGGFGVTSTDGNGSFVVPDLEFPDSTTFFLQALTAKGSDNARLAVNESFPAPVYAQQSLFSRHMTIESATKDAFIIKAQQRAKFDEDIWSINLNEVVVTAPKIRKKEPRDDFWLNSSSDYTLTRETIDAYKFSFIKDYLTMIPGLVVITNNSGDFIYKLNGTMPPAKIFIDGIELENPSDVNYLPTNAVESIDVLKWASLLGVR